jgi:asparagine synthase (glutamine-hydrolysing)
MPGLVGIISRQSEALSRRELASMVATMMHDDSYAHGSVEDRDLGVYIGWVCHRGGFIDCMPFLSGRKSKTLVFHGEVFTDERTLSSPLNGASGVSVEDATGVMALLGDGAPVDLLRLNGFFCGVLIKKENGQATLFNDRYGMQRVYYREERDRLVFASEAKAILAVCPDARQLLPMSVGEQVSMGCVLDNRSLFTGIHLLPGGSCWTIRSGEVVKRVHYFHPREWEDQETLGKEDYYSQLTTTFRRILPQYLRSSRDLAVSLTGGLDTRMIMAHARKDPGTLPCYTFGSTYRDSFDVRVARRVAEICGQPHTTFRVGDAFLKQFASLAEEAVYIADGTMEATDATELYLNRLCREVAMVRITGNYGSEILRSIRAFKPRRPSPEVFSEDLLRYADAAHESFAEAARGHNLTFAAFKQAPWFNYNRLSIEQSQLILRTPFMDNEIVKLAFQAPPDVIKSDEMSLRLVADGNAALGRLITNRGVGTGSMRLWSRTRQSAIDALRLAEMAWDYAMPQWVARIERRISRLHPEYLFLGRHRFSHFRLWFRNELAPYVKDVCLDRSTLNRPYLNGKAVERAVTSHLRGRGNYTREISKVITLELLHRSLVERVPPTPHAVRPPVNEQPV